MKNKIIVTGGCGYIGSHTVVELIENNYEVVILDNLSNSTEETLERIFKITGIKPTFIHIDLKDSTATNAIFSKHKDAKAVINFAAHKAVGESVLKPVMYYKNNLYSLLNVISAQIENGIEGFIFSSSATVYGTPKTLPITEKNKTKRPFSPYGNTKKIAEEIIEDTVKANSNFNSISLRYFNPIGAHESGLIGELPTGIPNNLMPYITQTAVGIREKLMVFGNDYPTKDGTPIRDYIHVVDLAKAHIAALERLLKNNNKKDFEVFNVGTGTGSSVLEVIQAFEKVSKTKLNYKIVGRREGDVTSAYADTALAKVELGWETEKTLDEALLAAWQWQLKQ